MRKTEKAALTSVIASALMAAGMIATSVVTGSVSILAQGIHTRSTQSLQSQFS